MKGDWWEVISGSVATSAASQARQRSKGDPIWVNQRLSAVRLSSCSFVFRFVSIRGCYSRSGFFVCLVRTIRSALPVDYAVLIEMNYQEPLLGKRSVEGNKLLGFA